MHHYRPEKPFWHEQQRRIEKAANRLREGERHSRIFLAVIAAATLICLALVLSELWTHPWVQADLRGVSP